MSAINIGLFERCQLDAARSITCQLLSTPFEAVLTEAGFSYVDFRFRSLSSLKGDEWKHLYQSDNRHQMPFAEVRSRLKRKDWRSPHRHILTRLYLLSSIPSAEQTHSRGSFPTLKNIFFPCLKKPTTTAVGKFP